MTYDSIDNIPLKLYMKIESTGNVSLLTNEKNDLFDCKKVWDKIKTQYNELGLNPGAKKILDATQRVELMKTKYDFIIAATNALDFEHDEELETELRAFGRTLNPKTYKHDLERIKREAANIMIKVRRLENQLPKVEEDGKRSTIDKVILGYCSITGLQYNTNEITVVQFDALKSIFEEKLNSIEKQNANNNPKKSK